MRSSVVIFSLLAALAGTQLASCWNEPFDQKAMLQSLGSTVIIPAYQACADEAKPLVDAASRFCDAPTTSGLSDLQDQWKAMRLAWKRTDAINFGPYADQPWRLGPKIDFWPVREDTIEENLAIEEPLTFDLVSALGASSRGIATLEYLIFDPAGSGVVLDRFEAPTGEQRCNYTVALAEDLRANALAMVDAWSPEGDDYLGALASSGEPGTPFMSIRDASNEIINRMLFLTENIMRLKLGKPLGLESGGEPQPELVESRYSDHSIEDILANLDGIESLYRGRFGGRRGTGVQHWVRWFSPDVDAQMLAAILRARWAIEDIPEPLRDAVLEGPDVVQVAYDQVRELRNTIGVDVVNALAGAVTFNDTDAD